jgi:uncharacterized protein YutE (UPF0331/DUF86 family)
MMVADVEIIRDRESRVRRCVADLRDFGRITEAAFLENRERQYAVLHALQLAIEGCLDIATHLCAADDLGVPSSYVDAVDLLERAGAFDGRVAEAMRRMARFRNRIVHLYAQVDLPTIFAILQDRLDDFDDYLAAIERYLAR